MRLVEGDPQSCVIRFFDRNGLDMSETEQRKVERLLNREDFRRVPAGEIGDIGFPPRALEHYSTALESTIDVDRVRAERFKVVIDYGYGSTSFVMPNLLAKLGADVLAVNPYASTAGILEYDPKSHAENVAALVRTSGAHVGAAIDPDGEHLTIIDDEGHVLTHTEALLALLVLVGDHLLGDRVALPVSRDAPRRAPAGGEGPQGAVHEAVDARAHGRSERGRGRASGPASTAATSSPDSCPRSTPRPRS